MTAGAQRSPASDFALSLLSGLVAQGLRHLVLAPGSRSQSLALAALHLASEGVLQVYVRVDERVAGFTALGLARESGVPAAVLCTSGTAAANLLPASMEAFHAGVPLLLLTADRPPELRGVGANQATTQLGLFSPFARFEQDVAVPGDAAIDALALAASAVAASLGVDDGSGIRGPVHLNLPAREPLSGALLSTTALAPGVLPRAPLHEPFELLLGPRTVVVAGADAGPVAEEIAHAASWPLIAEIVSGARFGRNLVHGYRALLGQESLGGRVQRAVVFGHPTLSRELTAFLSRAELDVVAVRCGGEALNLNGHTQAVAAVRVASGEPDHEWLSAWMRASAAELSDLSEAAPEREALASHDPARRAGAVRKELDAVRRELDRALLVDTVWKATWPHDRLMFGSSRLVRVADEVLGGKKLNVHANRGLAGIDGTIATATGIALASQSSGAPGVTRVLLGDLALLHDVGALLLPGDEPAPRMQVIVGNDGGGTIFDALEVAATASPEDFDRAFYTPQAVELAALADAYGWQYARVTTRAGLEQLLIAPVPGPQLIEVPLPR